MKAYQYLHLFFGNLQRGWNSPQPEFSPLICFTCCQKLLKGIKSKIFTYRLGKHSYFIVTSESWGTTNFDHVCLNPGFYSFCHIDSLFNRRYFISERSSTFSQGYKYVYTLCFRWIPNPQEYEKQWISVWGTLAI